MKINTSGAGRLLNTVLLKRMEEAAQARADARRSQMESQRQQQDQQWRAEQYGKQRQDELTDAEAARKFQMDQDAARRGYDLQDQATEIQQNENEFLRKTGVSDAQERSVGLGRGAAMGTPGQYRSQPEYEAWMAQQDRGARNQPDPIDPRISQATIGIKQRLQTEAQRGNLEGYTSSPEYQNLLATVMEADISAALDIQAYYGQLAQQAEEQRKTKEMAAQKDKLTKGPGFDPFFNSAYKTNNPTGVVRPFNPFNPRGK